MYYFTLQLLEIIKSMITEYFMITENKINRLQEITMTCYSICKWYDREYTLKDIKNAKNQNYYFLHSEHFQPSLTSKSAGNDTMLLWIPNTNFLTDTGHHQLRIAGLLCFIY